MYNVSSHYLEIVQETTRTWDIYIDVTLHDGTQLKLTKQDLDLGSFKVKEGATCSDTIQIGSTYADSVEFRIVNDAGKFTDYDLYGAKLWPYVGLDLSGSSDFEYVPLGEFNILDPVKKFSTISVTGFSNMSQLNRVFDASQVSFPTDTSTLLKHVAQQCGIRVSKLATQEVAESVQVIDSLGSSECTCRDVLVGICLFLLKNARFNRVGELEFFWYSDSNRRTSKNTRVGNSSYGDSTIMVTGVYLEDAFGATYTVGSDVYAIALPFSPLIQGPEMSQILLTKALVKLSQFTYRPATITWIGDPALQAGDILTHEDTAVGDCVLPIMRLVHTFAGTEILESVGTDVATNVQPSTSERKAMQAFSKSEKDKNDVLAELQRTTNSISLTVSAGSVGNKAEITLSVAGKDFKGYIDLTGLVSFKDLSADGETVISGNNISTGVIKSEDGSITLDLTNNQLAISMPSNGAARTLNFQSSGLWGYGEDTDTGVMYPVLIVQPALLGSKGNKQTTLMGASGSDLVLATAASAYAAPGFVCIGTTPNSKVKILGKAVSWRDNGDGTFSLIGQEEVI